MSKPKQGTYMARMTISSDIQSMVPEHALRSELREQLQKAAANLATPRSNYIVVESTERYRLVPDERSPFMLHAILKAYIARLTKKGYSYPSSILRLPK